MSKPSKLRLDMNEVAYRLAQAATGEGIHLLPPGSGGRNEAARRGAMGGKKDEKFPAEVLTKKIRTSIANIVPRVRWRADS